jgi:hypothetical protein
MGFAALGDRVGALSFGACGLKSPHHHRIERRVDLLDAHDVRLKNLHRRQIASRTRRASSEAPHLMISLLCSEPVGESNAAPPLIWGFRNDGHGKGTIHLCQDPNATSC